MRYNGYKNYETWNIALWIQKDESLYYAAKGSLNYNDFMDRISGYESKSTPDNVRWDDERVDVKSLDQLLEELRK